MEDFKSDQWFSNTANSWGDIFIADDNHVGRIRVMLCFAVSSENYARLKNNHGSVLCVYCLCNLMLVWSTPCCSHPTEDVIRPTLANAGEVLSCMEKKKKLLMKPYYLGNENVPWQFSPAYPVLTQVLTFSISSSSGIWRLAHTELIQLPLWDWDWDAITLKSRNLGWRSCLIDHSHTESCGKLGNGTYQWCCTTFHRGCWTLQQLLAHCFWADLREICSAAFISNA